MVFRIIKNYFIYDDLKDIVDKIDDDNHTENIYISINEKCNCPICLENECNIITDCKHYYCKNCIDNWFKTQHTCPYCRKNNIDYDNINYV